MDEKLIKTIAWSGRAAISSKHATASSAEPNSVVVDGATFTHGYVSVNGIRLHYLMGGDGERPVLLVHGFPGSWRSWEPLMGALVHAGFTPSFLIIAALAKRIFQLVATTKKAWPMICTNLPPS